MIVIELVDKNGLMVGAEFHVPNQKLGEFTKLIQEVRQRLANAE